MTFFNPLKIIQRKRMLEKKMVKERFVKTGMYDDLTDRLHEKQENGHIKPSELPF